MQADAGQLSLTAAASFLLQKLHAPTRSVPTCCTIPPGQIGQQGRARRATVSPIARCEDGGGCVGDLGRGLSRDQDQS